MEGSSSAHHWKEAAGSLARDFDHPGEPASHDAAFVPDPGVASDAATGEQPPQWNIQPEPTDEELVALVTVLSLVQRQAAPAPGASPEGSRWARAGRVAALVPWSRVPGNGWGRGGPGQGQA